MFHLVCAKEGISVTYWKETVGAPDIREHPLSGHLPSSLLAGEQELVSWIGHSRAVV